MTVRTPGEGDGKGNMPEIYSDEGQNKLEEKKKKEKLKEREGRNTLDWEPPVAKCEKSLSNKTFHPTQ